jgi:hypothetical protein
VQRRRSTLPGQSQSDNEQANKDCAGMLAKLAPHAPDKEWLKRQMNAEYCNENGTAMSLREKYNYLHEWKANKRKYDEYDASHGFHSPIPDHNEQSD